MKNLLKLAMGAAIAGALVNALMKRAVRRQDAPADAAADAPMPTELVADSSSVGEGSGDDRVLPPDDGRVAPRTLNS